MLQSGESTYMEFFNQAITVLQTLVVAIGADLGVWGVVNLMEGYGNDNPGAKNQGMKQLMLAVVSSSSVRSLSRCSPTFSVNQQAIGGKLAIVR